MNTPEKFLIAMILVGYVAAEVMLAQHGATTLEMAAALVFAALLVLYVYLTARRAGREVAQEQGTDGCSHCAAPSCGNCASTPRPPARR